MGGEVQMKLSDVVFKIKEHDDQLKNHEHRLKFLEDKFKNIATTMVEIKVIALKAIKSEKIKWVFGAVVLILLFSILGK